MSRKDVTHLITSDRTLDALKRAWRNEALEDAARIAELHAINPHGPAYDAFTVRACSEYIAASIRTLKDKRNG